MPASYSVTSSTAPLDDFSETLPFLAAPGNSLRMNDQLEHALLAEWMDAAKTGLVVLDDTSRVVMLNLAVCQLLAVDGAQALNRPARQLLRSLSDIASMSQWLNAPESEGDLHASRHGPEGPVHLLFNKRAVRHSHGAFFKMLCITDVTALLESQKQVEAHHRQWQALNAAVVISDARQPDMPIVYVNPMFERATGYTSAETLGRNCRFLQGLETHQPALGPLREAIKRQTNGFALLRNFRKDGSLFMNELFVSAVKDAQNQVMHYVGIQHMQTDSSAEEPGNGSAFKTGGL